MQSQNISPAGHVPRRRPKGRVALLPFGNPNAKVPAASGGTLPNRIQASQRTFAGRHAAVLSVALIVTACAGMETRDRLDNLELSVTTYESALRWGDYDAAALYRVSRTGPYPPINTEPLQAIRVASYEIVNQTLNATQTEATVAVLFRYYYQDVGQVATLRDVQKWWYAAAAKRWFLDGELPDFQRHYE